MLDCDLFAAYARTYNEPPRLSASEDWRFQLQDVRDASGAPLDLSGYALRLQFRPEVLRGMLIADLAQGYGITVTPSADPSIGPTVTILSRAVNRTWSTLVDTPIVGDLMLTRGSGGDSDNVFLRRISFTATWSSTKTDGGLTPTEPSDGGSADASDEQIVTLTATTTISGHRLVRGVSGGAGLCSTNIPADADTAIGISTGGAATGASLSIRYAGPMTDSTWTWEPGPIFAGPDGILTQTPTRDAFEQQVGTALSSTKIIIEIEPAFIFAN